ncbi:MAG: 50S ribosomal protein L25 [Parcubacteria group bacterium GW2011_GWC2_38_7]|nr:MAG: 50S ribosomal protein L25 [Parcubacteria group bacterium GW2011_GWC2_38_7]
MIYDFKATVRKELKKKVGALRVQGIIPGVVYGPEVKENINLSLDSVKLEKIYHEAGENSLINLQLEGEAETREVLIKDIAFEPVSHRVSHVDFYQIKRGVKLNIEPELVFVGIAPAVKEIAGILIKSLAKIEIRCLPKNMISHIEVDLTTLKNFGDKILVKDLKIPADVEVLTDLEETVAVIAEPRAEEVATPVAEVKEPEVVGKKDAPADAAAEADKKDDKK